MNYLLMIDSFKGCLTSSEAEQAAGEGIRKADQEAVVWSVPVSDGGEGMLEAFLAALGGRKEKVWVFDAMMRRTEAEYGISGKTAVIEVAQAIGLSAVPPEKRNPLVATSYGVGQLLCHAIDKGCDTLIIGLGGSATSDCGLGMLKALVDHFAPGKGFDAVPLRPLKFILACDVDNPLYGDQGAAAVFGPQKGASPEMVALLDRRARTFATLSARHYGYDDSALPGAGAAGGLGYAFMQYLGAERRNGTDLLFHILKVDDLFRDADVVITGEGKADRQTLMGKLPMGILRHARSHPVSVVLIAGQVTDLKGLLHAGFSQVICINPPDCPLEEALKPEVARRRITDVLFHATL